MKEVLTCKQMQNAEKDLFNSGVTELQLMERAVDGIFQHVDKSLKTIIVCGKGNNGGDGLGLSLKLHNAGCMVDVLLVSENHKECSQHYLKIIENLNIKVYKKGEQVDFSCYDQIIDCIFGIGFHGEVAHDIRDVIESINNSGKRVVSVDIPSGINGDSGEGNVAVKSQLTVAVGSLKVGNVFGSIKDFCQKVVVCDIGIDKNTDIFLFEESDLKKSFIKRSSNCHKGNFGYVAVLGGSLKYSGASKLANLSLCALKCGAGVSKLIVPENISQSVLPYLTVSTLDTLPSANGCIKFSKQAIDQALEKVNTLAFGMGLGQSEEIKKTLSYILENYNINLIIDADGLNALAKIDKSLLKNTKCKVVLTPHILEFSRISGYEKSKILKNPFELSKNFAKEYDLILLLKGASTIVTDGNVSYVVNRGCGGMATAGSGDVLSGAICGALGWMDYSLNSVCSACYVCGIAGELASSEYGDISMTALDTLKFLPYVIKNI